MAHSSKSGSADKERRQISVPLLRHGKVSEVLVDRPTTGESDDELLPEIKSFIQSLEDNHQIEHEGDEPTGHETHRLETAPDGTRRLKRKRFSAI